MISAIICSRNSVACEWARRNLMRTVGSSEFEFIRIDNSSGQMGICAAYNQGIKRSHGDILIFLHEDVFHLEIGWGARLVQKFHQQANLGLVGVAGTQILVSNPPLWTWAGRPWLFGKVVHELDKGERFFMTVFSTESGDREVVAIDGCWFAVRRTALEDASFDANTFPGFHFYDLDLCMQLRRHWTLLASTDILVKHRSAGQFGQEWKQAANAFRIKWSTELPATVNEIKAPSAPGGEFHNVDLKGRLSQTILV